MTSSDFPQMLSRRQVIRNTAIAGGAVAASSMLAIATAAEERQPVELEENSVILFQGDSITDAHRKRDQADPNNPRGLGDGYPFLIASRLQARFPRKQLRCYNRGVSGNRVPDLDARWQKDCIDLKPTVLSILVGVNDIWHRLNGKYDGTVQQYEEGLDALLKKTKDALPETRLVICEPFALRCGAVNDDWYPEFDERRAACKRVANNAGAIWIPFQSMFDKACKQSEASYWAGDGVHPSMAGHGLMATTWMKTVFPWKQIQS